MRVVGDLEPRVGGGLHSRCPACWPQNLAKLGRALCCAVWPRTVSLPPDLSSLSVTRGRKGANRHGDKGRRAGSASCWTRPCRVALDKLLHVLGSLFL